MGAWALEAAIARSLRRLQSWGLGGCGAAPPPLLHARLRLLALLPLLHQHQRPLLAPGCRLPSSTCVCSAVDRCGLSLHSRAAGATAVSSGMPSCGMQPTSLNPLQFSGRGRDAVCPLCFSSHLCPQCCTRCSRRAPAAAVGAPTFTCSARRTIASHRSQFSSLC